MQPNSPTQTTSPVQTPQTVPMTPQPPIQKSKKPLIISLVVGGVVLLAAAAALIIYFTMFAISKADYQQALETAKLSYEKGDALTEAAADLNSSDNDKIDTGKQKSKTAITEMKQALVSLEKEKALNDEAVKAKSTPYIEKMNKAAAYYDSYLTDMGDLRKLINDCAKTFEDMPASQTAAARATSLDAASQELEKCTTKIKDGKETMKNEDAIDLSEVFIKSYSAIVNHSKSAAKALRENNATTYQITAAALNKTLSNMRADSNEIINNVNKKSKSLNPQTEYKALTDELKAKL